MNDWTIKISESENDIYWVGRELARKSNALWVRLKAAKSQVWPISLSRILNLVSQKRSALLVEVNPAYTSQACSVCGCLGSRKLDKFHCTNQKCGVVLQADYNGAVNVLHRKGDPEIGLYTPYRKVKEILIERQSIVGGGTAASKTPTLVQISLFGESN